MVRRRPRRAWCCTPPRTARAPPPPSTPPPAPSRPPRDRSGGRLRLLPAQVLFNNTTSRQLHAPGGRPRRSPATVGAGLRLAAGSSPSDQNRARVGGALCQLKGRGPIPGQLSVRAAGTVQTRYRVSSTGFKKYTGFLEKKENANYTFCIFSEHKLCFFCATKYRPRHPLHRTGSVWWIKIHFLSKREYLFL